MKKVELLAPAGDFESLVIAVQSGADAVYFGASKFNARINTTNFDEQELIKGITYAKLRKVKTHLVLNTLIKNDEMGDALEILEIAYKAGLDSVIIQDLGLAKKVLEIFPDLEIHSSTQMTTYNLNGVKELEKLGFKRVVLARELPIDEIQNICENTKTEIEVFIHGALCICYSGQCLMSSMIGGRSGNRGKCAGPCRLPYELIEKNSNRILDKGYLLSSKDVVSLDMLPDIIKAGVKALKIEGRMKSPEYVGIVTSIYRKYIDLAYSHEKYIVEDEDKEKLIQMFNRGGSSTGYLKGKLGKDMIYTKKPNHIGVLIGMVESYNQNRGYVKFRTEKELELGDVICINDNSCKISELMKNNQNIKVAEVGQNIVIGRIKGDIKSGDKIYRTAASKLSREIADMNSKENVKRSLNCTLILKCFDSMKVVFEDADTGIKIEITSDYVVQKAEKEGTKRERIIDQISKTGNTIFSIKYINIDMDDDIFIPISRLNEIRREGLDKLEEEIINTFKRKDVDTKLEQFSNQYSLYSAKRNDIQFSLLLNNLDISKDYSGIKNIDNIYVPFNYFMKKEYENIMNQICNTFKTYIYLPTITRTIYEELIIKKIEKILSNQKIEGIVISNISQLELLRGLNKENLKLVANYTMNIFNNDTVDKLEELGISKYTVSPELDKNGIKSIEGDIRKSFVKNSKENFLVVEGGFKETCVIEKEIIVYGRTVLMTSEYCPIGKAKDCNQLCKKGDYMLKDRLGFEFPIYTDTIACNTVIYNSKITSIDYKDLKTDSIRIDVLDESIEEINNIIWKYRNHEKLEGQEYTNGNLNKEI